MPTMNVSLPEALKAFVDEEVAAGGYGSVSEYVRELLRAAQERKTEARLQSLLLEGLESGQAMPSSPQLWKDIRADVARRISAHKARHGRR